MADDSTARTQRFVLVPRDEADSYALMPTTASVQSGYVTLQTGSGFYVSTEETSADELADRHGIGRQQTFSLMSTDAPQSPPPPSSLQSGYVTLRGVGGYFVTADVGKEHALAAVRHAIAECEVFYLEVLDSGYCALLATNGKWVSSEQNLGDRLIANRDEISTWERFALFPLGGDTFALRTSNGKFVAPASDAYGPLFGLREEIGEWEAFTIETFEPVAVAP